MYLFKLVFLFTLDEYPEVELLDPMVILFSCLPFLKHTLSLPVLPFLLSFLPPGDAVTVLKAACDPSVRAGQEDGPQSRPFASDNFTVPVLFEACCESPPCWHFSRPHTSFTAVE